MAQGVYNYIKEYSLECEYFSHLGECTILYSVIEREESSLAPTINNNDYYN